MKYYTHKPVELKKLTTQTVNFKRFYETPDGKLYPSITTVLSTRNKKGLFEWRKKVGDEIANYVARTSANRGTAVHHMCEDYLNNFPVDWPDKWKEHEKKFLPYCLFKQLKKSVLEKIDNIRSQECALFSHKYRVAGRVDCIAEYDGELSIIDFKTSTKERTDEYNENYYIQAAAYAEMFEEQTGTPIEQIVILVVTEDGVVQEFVKNKYDYIPLLVESIDNFTKDWEEENDKLDRAS
tara:strand:+ start:50 stop:763 length:714 start_codon:yes stop_codon:yes gene_type:complete